MSSYKKFEYKPTSIRKLLSEMKDIADLILDLAYSAILFDIEELAEEVQRLEERMDNLIYQIRMTATLASRDVEDAQHMAGILQIANASEVISDAAREIVNVIHEGFEPDEIVINALKTSDERIMKTVIEKNSSMIKKRIKEIKLAITTGMYILVVRRDQKWFYRPRKDFCFYQGDVIIARGCDDGVNLLRKISKGEVKL